MAEQEAKLAASVAAVAAAAKGVVLAPPASAPASASAATSETEDSDEESESSRALSFTVDILGTILFLLLTEGDKPERRRLNADQVGLIVPCQFQVCLVLICLILQLSAGFKGVNGWRELLLAVGFKQSDDGMLRIDIQDMQVIFQR